MVIFMKQEIIRIDLKGVNCYLGKREEGFILFDTGGHITLDKEFTNRREELMSFLEKAGCRPGNLKAIVLTHGDNDHVANAAYLRDKYQSIIAMHQDDMTLVNQVTLNKIMESFHYRSIIYKIVFKLMRKQITKIMERVLKDFIEFKPDIILQEGDSLSPYGFMGDVLHLPGHTAGSIGVLCEGGELIAGDIFANMKKPCVAPNAIDFKELKKSVKNLNKMKITKIYPGHGSPFMAYEVGIGNR